MPERSCRGRRSVIYRWDALGLGGSSSQGRSMSSESSLPKAVTRQPEMLLILGRTWSGSASGSGAGSSDRGKLRRSHGATVRSSKEKSGVEQRVSSLDSRRCESREQGVWGLDVVSGLGGLRGEGTWL